MAPRKAALYDEDDFDDGYDYDDEYEDYDDGDTVPTKPAAKQAAPKAAASKGAAARPAQAAGASKLAQYICDPAPPRPNGRPQPGAVRDPLTSSIKVTGSHAAAASATSSSTSRRAAAPAEARFDFASPSPDDEVLAAQQGKGRSGGPAVAPPINRSVASTNARLAVPPAPKLAPSPAMMQPAAKAGTPAAAAAAAASTSGQQANAAAEALAAGLQLGGAAAAAAGAGPSSRPQSGGPHRPPRVSGYSLEPDLAKDVAAAAAAEQPGGGGRSRLHLVVLGHVDAGKSTLMGRLLHDLGQVGAKEVQRNQREAAQAGKGSFAWAWVLDERPEERARGVTVDVAMSHFTTPRFNVTLLDAPGHRDFVPNMITGAAQADAALLLVDGSPGGFEAGFGGDEVVAAGAGGGGGQTREHAQLARSLGIEQLAVVISKLDTVGYSQARFREVQGQLLPFLKGCGFREGALQWLPAVGPSGQNLAAPPTEAALKAWWSGPTVVQAVDSFQPRERATERPLRLPVSDVTTKGKQGGGVGVGGKLEGGAVRVGTKVALVPSGEVATVKAIEVDGQLAALARAGDTADLTLQGLDPANLFIGAVLCHPAFPVPLVAKFEARLVVLDVAVPILKGQNVTIHAHTAREAGHVSALLSVLDAKTGEVVKRNPRCLVKGQTAIVQVTPARAMCLEEYADYRALGRVALRDGGRTVAVGVVSSILG